MDPTYYPANINRGLAHTDLGSYNEALDDFNRALEFGDIPLPILAEELFITSRENSIKQLPT